MERCVDCGNPGEIPRCVICAKCSIAKSQALADKMQRLHAEKLLGNVERAEAAWASYTQWLIVQAPKSALVWNNL